MRIHAITRDDAEDLAREIAPTLTPSDIASMALTWFYGESPFGRVDDLVRDVATVHADDTTPRDPSPARVDLHRMTGNEYRAEEKAEIKFTARREYFEELRDESDSLYEVDSGYYMGRLLSIIIELFIERDGHVKDACKSIAPTAEAHRAVDDEDDETTVVTPDGVDVGELPNGAMHHTPLARGILQNGWFTRREAYDEVVDFYREQDDERNRETIRSYVRPVLVNEAYSTEDFVERVEEFCEEAAESVSDTRVDSEHQRELKRNPLTRFGVAEDSRMECLLTKGVFALSASGLAAFVRQALFQENHGISGRDRANIKQMLVDELPAPVLLSTAGGETLSESISEWVSR